MTAPTHHQLAELVDVVGVHRITMFWGCRGSGKSSLLTDLGRAVSGTHRVVTIDATRATSLHDLNRPLAAELGCPPDALDARGYDGPPVLALLDQCERLFDEPWVGAFQDEWRALFTAPESRGKVTCVLASRPRFRDILGGRASPLANAAWQVRARPLTRPEIETRFGCPRPLASALQSKTGGHPWLTERLASVGTVEALVQSLPTAIDSNAGYLLGLIDDHGRTARAVISDLLDGRNAIAERVVLDRHFRGRADDGLNVLDDLVGSGLLAKPDLGTVRINAEMLQAQPGMRRRLAARRLPIPSEPPQQHLEACALLYQVENRLRADVLSTSSDLTPDWWERVVPTELVAKAEGRRDAERDGDLGLAEDVHPIAYLDLGEVADLVLSEPGWSQAFTYRYGMPSDDFRSIIAALLRVRNMVAHNRPIADPGVAHLRAAARRLGPTT